MMALASTLSIAMASLIVKKLTATETPEAIVTWMVVMQSPLALIPAISVWQSNNVLGSLFHTRINSIMYEMNYLWPFGYKYICSTNVKLT